MNNNITFFLALFLLIMSNDCVRAETDDNSLKSAKVISKLAGDKDFDYVKFYVDGIAAGIRAANAATQQSPIFCPPPQLPISGDLLLSLVRQAIADKPEAGGFSFEIVAISSMKSVFSCDQKRH
jgi:hypothetical protein